MSLKDVQECRCLIKSLKGVCDGSDCVIFLSSDASARLSGISHTLSVIFPGRADDLIGQTVVRLHTDAPPSSELHVRVS